MKHVLLSVLLLLLVASRAAAQELPVWEIFPPEDVNLLSRLPESIEEPEYPVEAIAATIVTLNWRQGPCARWCTEDRTSFVDEDRSEYVISFEEAEELAENLLLWSEALPAISLVDAMAIAWHESKFHRYARGSSGEAGIFQQNLTYLYPDSALDSTERAERVTLLYDFEFAVYSFYLNAYGDLLHARSQGRRDDYWSCYYHEGETCTQNGMSYRADHLREIGWMERLLERFTRAHEDGTLMAMVESNTPAQ